jgi:hypothetical protein
MARLPFAAQGKKQRPHANQMVRPAKTLGIQNAQFEFRLEVSLPFVLNELRRFLNVRQFRLEMQPRSPKLRKFL